MTARSATEIEGDGYAEGFDDGYDEGWSEGRLDAELMADAAYREGFAAGQANPDLERVLRQAANEAGGDLLEGVRLRWDAAERRLVIEPLSRLGAEG